MVNITVEIMHDDDNLYNPREDDNYGIMACAHKRYSLSDEGEEIQVGEFSSWEEVEEYLIYDVGCTQTTEDGKSCIFDDSDDPGIIYIPKPWKRQGL